MSRHPRQRLFLRTCSAAGLIMIFLLAAATTAGPAEQSISRGVAAPEGFRCGYHPSERETEDLRAAVERGEIPDPATRYVPAVAESPLRFGPAGPRSLTTDDIHPFEDSAQVLLTDWTLEQIIDLMVEAANDLLAAHGDNYDFVGFWLNFDPHHLFGGAFYKRMENNVSGIGIGLFNYRPDYGLAGENVEGMLMLYNVNTYWWDPPGGGYSDFTQLMISHEFEHRWALHLPPLADGRDLQGAADSTQGGPCGKVGHWSYRVDGQGSAMEIREYTGERPAILDPDIWDFNTDIPGGVFSYPDLYLMGYVSPEEMDTGASELRFMDMTANCPEYYQGIVSHFSSADIIEAAGSRVPDSQTSQKDFRTGWVMIHLPGDPPDQAELEKAVAILEEHQAIWNIGTLGRGTMDHSLDDETTDVVDAEEMSTAPGPTLLAPTPTPLTTETTLQYRLPGPASITLAIHDVTGRRITTLEDGFRPPGEHSLTWDGRDDSGLRVASGVYLACLTANGSIHAKKIPVVK